MEWWKKWWDDVNNLRIKEAERFLGEQYKTYGDFLMGYYLYGHYAVIKGEVVKGRKILNEIRKKANSLSDIIGILVEEIHSDIMLRNEDKVIEGIEKLLNGRLVNYRRVISGVFANSLRAGFKGYAQKALEIMRKNKFSTKISDEKFNIVFEGDYTIPAIPNVPIESVQTKILYSIILILNGQIKKTLRDLGNLYKICRDQELYKSALLILRVFTEVYGEGRFIREAYNICKFTGDEFNKYIFRLLDSYINGSTIPEPSKLPLLKCEYDNLRRVKGLDYEEESVKLSPLIYDRWEGLKWGKEKVFWLNVGYTLKIFRGYDEIYLPKGLLKLMFLAKKLNKGYFGSLHTLNLEGFGYKNLSAYDIYDLARIGMYFLEKYGEKLEGDVASFNKFVSSIIMNDNIALRTHSLLANEGYFGYTVREKIYNIDPYDFKPICPHCDNPYVVQSGYKNETPQFKCSDCKKTFSMGRKRWSGEADDKILYELLNLGFKKKVVGLALDIDLLNV